MSDYFNKLTTVLCNQCGSKFGIHDDFFSSLQKTGNSFFCPNGHSLSFAKKDELVCLRLEIQNLNRSRENQDSRIRTLESHVSGLIVTLKTQKRRIAAYKGKLNSLRRKVDE